MGICLALTVLLTLVALVIVAVVRLGSIVPPTQPTFLESMPSLFVCVLSLLQLLFCRDLAYIMQACVNGSVSAAAATSGMWRANRGRLVQDLTQASFGFLSGVLRVSPRNLDSLSLL